MQIDKIHNDKGLRDLKDTVINILVLLVKVIAGIIILFIPNWGNYLVLESNAMGAYFVAFFVVACVIMAFSVLFISYAVIEFIQKKRS